MADDPDAHPFAALEADVLLFLRTLEAAQQDILFHEIDAAQQRLSSIVGDSIPRALAAWSAVDPNTIEAPLHGDLLRALEHLDTARNGFLRRLPWPDFAGAYIGSRHHHCEALSLLYRHKAQLPLLETHFRLPDSDIPAADDGPGLGRIEATDRHHHYSLYVPEYYDGNRNWPLVVCLHGGYGRDDDYLWTWLRAARSRGMLLLSPKSMGATWSIMNPPADAGSVLAMLDEVEQGFQIDRTRILLTGLSDGATFSFQLGLRHPQRFSALAPIAGVLPPDVDPLLREGRANKLPIQMVHGVHDAIFPVSTARSASALLQELGYMLTYTELPDWGHALTYRINETLILPWFRAVRG